LPETVSLGLSEEFAADKRKVSQWSSFTMRIVERMPDLRVVINTIRDAATPKEQRPFAKSSECYLAEI
jgi:hypothetical protein